MKTTTKRIDLRADYTQQIESANWEAIVKEACETTDESDDGDGLIGRAFIGSVFSVMPSGKFYMPWTTNQTWRDIVKDELFMELLERKAGECGGWIESGEGDPCDLFFAMKFEDDDND